MVNCTRVLSIVSIVLGMNSIRPANSNKSSTVLALATAKLKQVQQPAALKEQRERQIISKRQKESFTNAL